MHSATQQAWSEGLHTDFIDSRISTSHFRVSYLSELAAQFCQVLTAAWTSVCTVSRSVLLVSDSLVIVSVVVGKIQEREGSHLKVDCP